MKAIRNRIRQSTSTRRGKAIMAGILLVLVIAVTLAIVYWNAIKKQLIRDQVKSKVREKTERLYNIHYDNMELDEVNTLMEGFPETLLWEKPAGVASPGFHLQHMKGVIDRLLTYAKGQMLTADQLHYLKQEEQPPSLSCKTIELVEQFSLQVDKALTQLSATEETSLTSARGVGRAQLPSTVLGLLAHAAEHTQRHLGQLLVTAAILKTRQA